ncbi:NAD-dependent malic enzyme 1 [Hibiscus syriacus]|uniref:NAD-dependent malic enzyme 1 n=1 Tax=Hibiscus syriacus TaxID=106335 RepID=A0A6A2X0I3_HIBSY|nr:NAD-dependent malic enzyme 1 [Hibiscus syriacus]
MTQWTKVVIACTEVRGASNAPHHANPFIISDLGSPPPPQNPTLHLLSTHASYGLSHCVPCYLPGLVYRLKWKREAINKLIEEAILEAEEKAKRSVMKLMSRVESINGYGGVYLEKHSNHKVKLVDGSSFAVAVVLNTIPKGTTQNWLPRRAMSTWRAAGIVHALEGWEEHECGYSMSNIDKAWKASLKHGFQPLCHNSIKILNILSANRVRILVL